ncbi:hypothetical protein [Synechococcus sp. SynAce01]|uniref:hypothetical protein n=1 Tax=Synechococcus sp. SynAce01 TaxID=1916956 RepID=UPI001968DB77|nr:hypothetical protein [Synechococcus sp. SynAce01]
MVSSPWLAPPGSPRWTPAFISHLSRLGIPVIRLTEAETNADLDTLEQWLQSSSVTPAL